MTIVLLQAGLVLAGAPLLTGITRRLKARLQYRRGPSVWQPYRDLRKWWSKDAVESDAASPLTGIAPVIVVGVMAAAAVLVPMLVVDRVAAGPTDILVVIGLLALVRWVLVLLALDAGGAFGGMGGSREVAISALVEPGLVLAVAVAAAGAGSTDLAVIADRGLAAGLGLVGAPWLLAAAAFAIVAIAETGHEPVDNPDTHLELTMIHEGMVLEASGRRLALLTYAGHLKLVVITGLFAAVFVPFGMASGPDPAPGALVAAIVASALKLIVAAVALAVLDAGLAKLRILRLPSLLGLAAVFGATAIAASLWLPA